MSRLNWKRLTTIGFGGFSSSSFASSLSAGSGSRTMSAICLPLGDQT